MSGLAAALALFGTPQVSAAECESLLKLELTKARITLAVPIDGTFHEDTALGREGRIYDGLPQFCRIRGLATPVPGSEIEFEVWLPPKEAWTQRLHMVGNGAYSSNIYYKQMIARLRAGDAAVATNTGHRGRDLKFVIDRPESLVDYSHRAVHESVVAAKVVIAAYYHTPQKYAYFSGCSTGGYQGLSEAQRYPDDFDGIIVGAPGNNRTNLNFAFLWNYISNRRDGDDAAQILPNSKLPMITQAVTAKCDALDGVRDGVINDPPSCPFDINSLRCQGAETDACLTAEQIATVNKIYAGPKDVRTGQSLYPGFPFGSEGISAEEDTAKPGWSGYWANPDKPTEPQRADFFRYWVFNDPYWNWWNFNWGSDIDTVNIKIADVFNANNPDLSRFRARGGKIVMFMGWMDPVGAAGEAINYYEAVEGRSQAADAAARRKETQEFLRLFMVPGMGHCAGGPGATHFSSATRDSEPPVRDAAHDIAIALEKWVETGDAPEQLIATRFDDPMSQNRKIVFQRPLCVYPKVVQYTGGPTESAASFACVMPK